MSSDPRSDAPSPAAEPTESHAVSDEELIRERGADLLAALEARLPGSTRPRRADRALGARDLGRARPLPGDLAGPARNRAAARDRAALCRRGPRGPERGGTRRRRAAHSDSQAEHAARLAAGAGLPAAPCVWLEHWRERFEGGGPNRLYGGAIPLESRIIRAACAYALELEAGDPIRTPPWSASASRPTRRSTRRRSARSPSCSTGGARAASAGSRAAPCRSPGRSAC